MRNVIVCNARILFAFIGDRAAINWTNSVVWLLSIGAHIYCFGDWVRKRRHLASLARYKNKKNLKKFVCMFFFSLVRHGQHIVSCILVFFHFAEISIYPIVYVVDETLCLLSFVIWFTIFVVRYVFLFAFFLLYQFLVASFSTRYSTYLNNFWLRSTSILCCC